MLACATSTSSTSGAMLACATSTSSSSGAMLACATSTSPTSGAIEGAVISTSVTSASVTSASAIDGWVDGRRKSFGLDDLGLVDLGLIDLGLVDQDFALRRRAGPRGFQRAERLLREVTHVLIDHAFAVRDLPRRLDDPILRLLRSRCRHRARSLSLKRRRRSVRGRRSWIRNFDERLDLRQERIEADRLVQIVFGPGAQAAVLLERLLRGVRAHDDQRHVLQRRVTLELVAHREAVHARQLDREQDQIRLLA